MRNFKKENCKLQIRDVLVDCFGNKIILSGRHAFEWSISVYHLDGSITKTVFERGNIARREFKKIKRKKQIP